MIMTLYDLGIRFKEAKVRLIDTGAFQSYSCIHRQIKKNINQILS
jgi:hypothetical protein